MPKKKAPKLEPIQEDIPLIPNKMPSEDSLPINELDFGELVNMNLWHEVSVRVFAPKEWKWTIIAVWWTANCMTNPHLIISTLCEWIWFMFSQIKDMVTPKEFNEAVKRVIEHIQIATIDNRKPGEFIFKNTENEQPKK